MFHFCMDSDFRCSTVVWIQMFHCCINSDFRCSTVVWIQMFHCCMNSDFRCFTVVWIQILDVSLLYGYVPLLYEFRCFTVVWIQILDVSLLYGCSAVVWIQWSCKVRKTLSACNVWCVNLVNESVYSQTCPIDLPVMGGPWSI